MNVRENRGRWKGGTYLADTTLDALDEERVRDLVCAMQADGDFALEFCVKVPETKKQKYKEEGYNVTRRRTHIC